MNPIIEMMWLSSAILTEVVICLTSIEEFFFFFSTIVSKWVKNSRVGWKNPKQQTNNHWYESTRLRNRISWVEDLSSPGLTKEVTKRDSPSDQTVLSEVPCHSRYGTIKISTCSNAESAEQSYILQFFTVHVDVPQ